MKKLKVFFVGILLFLSTSLGGEDQKEKCELIKQKIEFYKKLQQSNSYVGDYSDVIEQYEKFLKSCEKPQNELRNLYRKSYQQSQKEGGLF